MLAVWAGLAAVLAYVAGRVRDWFDMTDEMRYERLAISIARTHSLVPRIHGVDIQSFSQLYPLLIAPVFRHGLVSTDLHAAHLLNGVIMSSVCVPVFFLSRRVSGRRWVAYAIALLSVCVPWILYATMLMTEVAAYPAFMWAVLAMQRAVAAPSRRNDLVAVAAIALAYFARTELIVLVLVLPLAILAYELGRGPRGLRRAVRAHGLLAAACALAVALAVWLELSGRLSSVVGIYGVYARGEGLLPSGLAGSLAEHVATFSLALGILPFVVGAGWLLASVVRQPANENAGAFACVGFFATAAIVVSATHFDVRYTGYVHDRFLLYLAPVVLLAMVCAALDPRRLRWSALVPAVIVSLGYTVGALPQWTWSDPYGRLVPDTPASILYRPLAGALGIAGMRATLAAATVALALGSSVLLARLSRSRAAVVLLAFAGAALVTSTGDVLRHYLRNDDWASRPLTRSPAGDFDFIDRRLGGHADVSLLPYPVSTNYFVSEQLWRDLEFWNKSVVRDVQIGSTDFAYTGIWFPTLPVRFDPSTGVAAASPTPYVLQSAWETRFRVAGPVIAQSDGVLLVDAGEQWRLAIRSSGLYDDGWTKPGVPATVRVFAAAGQRRARTRYVYFGVRAPDEVAEREVTVVSNLGRWQGAAVPGSTLNAAIRVCVPPDGFAVVRLRAQGSSTIPADLATSSASPARLGGVLLQALGLSDNVGRPCHVPALTQ